MAAVSQVAAPATLKEKRAMKKEEERFCLIQLQISNSIGIHCLLFAYCTNGNVS